MGAAFALLSAIGLVAGLYQDLWRPIFKSKEKVLVTRTDLQNSTEQVVSKLERIESMVGSYYDQEQGVIVLVGREAKSRVPIPLTVEDIAACFHLAKRSSEKPSSASFGCSFDEFPNSEFLQVKFFGELANTHLGYVLFLADYALKNYSVELAAGDQNIQTTLNLSDNFMRRFGSGNASRWARFWIESRPALYTSISNKLASVRETGILVRAEGDDLSHSIAEAFTERFDTLSKKDHNFAAFVRIVEVVAVSKWLAKSAALNKLDWLDACLHEDKTKTPIAVPKISIRQEHTQQKEPGVSISSILRIEGGVSLSFDSITKVVAADSFDIEVERMLRSLITDSLGTGPSFEFTFAQQSYIGIVL